MDKKHIKDQIIFVSKIYLGMILFIALPANILVSIIGGLFNGNMLNLLLTNTIGLFRAVFMLGVVIYGVIGLIYLFSILKRKSDIIPTDEYTRELPEYFPPAIASLLLDLSVETTTDYTATIAYLISKKRISLSKDSGEIETIFENQSFGSRHERYVFECITKQTKYDPNEFRKLVIYDAKFKKLIKEEKRKINFWRNIGIAFVAMFIFSTAGNFAKGRLLQDILFLAGLISELSFFAVIGYSIYSLKKYELESIARTEEGEVEAKKWAGLKKYLKEYTLIHEKEIKDAALFDDYIPYAIALNEAKAIEKFIDNNENYRKLIYGNIDFYN